MDPGLPASPPIDQPLAADVLRDGKSLIVRSGAVLPLVCPATGLPVAGTADGTYGPRQMTWIPPWVLTGLLAGGLAVFILMMVGRKSGVLTYGLAPGVVRQAERVKLAACLCLLAAAGCAVGFIGSGANSRECLVAMIALLLLGVGGLMLAGPLRVTGFREPGWFRLRGCSPEFLDTLPAAKFEDLK